MKRIAPVFIFSFVAVSASAAEPMLKGQKLFLVNAIDGNAKVDQQVQLKDSASCLYVGVLGRGNGEQRSTLAKMVDQLNSAGASWSIAINSQTCGDVKKAVSLVVPLRNLVNQKDYQGGDAVIAYPAN